MKRLSAAIHKVLYKSALLAMMIMVSCGDDDDDDTNPLVGVWESTTLSQTNCPGGLPDIDNFTCGSCIVNVFNADGTYTSTATVPGVLNETIEGTYSVNDAILTTCDQDGANCEESNISFGADTLIIAGEELGCELTVNFERG